MNKFILMCLLLTANASVLAASDYNDRNDVSLCTEQRQIQGMMSANTATHPESKYLYRALVDINEVLQKRGTLCSHVHPIEKSKTAKPDNSASNLLEELAKQRKK